MTDEDAIQFNEILEGLKISTKGANRDKINQLSGMFVSIMESAQQKIIKRKYSDLQYNYRSFNPVKKVSQAMEAITNSSSLYKEAKDDLEKAEKIVQDLLHAIELLDFDSKERDQLYADLKEIRIFRRKCKNFVELVEPLYQVTFKHPIILKDFSAAYRVIREKEKEIQDRKYHPRVRTDLAEAFEKLESAEKTIQIV
jgi:hypothetical protein